jgi:hypothetical protein
MFLILDFSVLQYWQAAGKWNLLLHPPASSSFEMRPSAAPQDEASSFRQTGPHGEALEPWAASS